MQPVDQAPIRICDLKKTNRKKQKERRHRNQARGEPAAIICGLRPLTSDLWLGLGPIFPAQPKEKEREKWNKPAVTILVVDQPLVAQLPEKDKPKRGDRGDNQRGASKTAIVSRGYGQCLRENGIQSALIISQEPKDESAADETLCRGAQLHAFPVATGQRPVRAEARRFYENLTAHRAVATTRSKIRRLAEPWLQQ